MYHEAIVKRNFLIAGLNPDQVDKLPYWMYKIWGMIANEETIKSQTPDNTKK